MNVEIAVSNLVGNTIMFLPMAFFLPIFWGDKKGSKRYLFICLAIIICVEVLQFVIGTGSMDIDDVILNFIGVLLGSILYRLKFVQFILKKLYIVADK